MLESTRNPAQDAGLVFGVLMSFSNIVAYAAWVLGFSDTRPRLRAAPVFPNSPTPPAVTKACVDRWIDDLSAYIAAHNPPAQRSILITGAMRCGKTIVARNICAQTGMVHIPADRVRNATYATTEGQERARLIKYVYKRLMLRHPTGIVIEGTVFMDRGVTLPVWAQARGIKCFAIGYTQDNPARKARSMMRFRKQEKCWTNGKRSDAEMKRMARKIVLRSRDIRTQCEAEGMTYLDLDSGRFDSELRRVSKTILREMDVRPVSKARDQKRTASSVARLS